MVCSQCDTTEGVKLRDSCTAYAPEPLNYWEVLLLDGEEPPDPNAPIPLCDPCAEDHYAYWAEMWGEYNRSRL